MKRLLITALLTLFAIGLFQRITQPICSIACSTMTGGLPSLKI